MIINFVYLNYIQINSKAFSLFLAMWEADSETELLVNGCENQFEIA